MLSARAVLHRDGLAIDDVACRHGRGRGEAGETAARHVLVLVRRGCFVRSADGVEALLDATTAYAMRPGEEQRYDHPHDGGDDCTAIELDEPLLATLWGGEPGLPAGALHVSPADDIRHRLLLAEAGRTDADPHELVERGVDLAAGLLASAEPRRVAAGRPATATARHRLADGAREALAADPDRVLPQLAKALGSSPHHLSRAFRASTGHTIARHRMRLRLRTALERLAAGDRDLARLAAETGFADQSHLCRVARAETGQTPAALRAVLADTARDR